MRSPSYRSCWVGGQPASCELRRQTAANRKLRTAAACAGDGDGGGDDEGDDEGDDDDDDDDEDDDDDDDVDSPGVCAGPSES